MVMDPPPVSDSLSFAITLSRTVVSTATTGIRVESGKNDSGHLVDVLGVESTIFVRGAAYTAQDRHHSGERCDKGSPYYLKPVFMIIGDADMATGCPNT